MADTVTNVFGGFINFIMGLIKYIQELDKYFRDTNDGKDVEMPDFPALGGAEETPVE